MEPPDIVNVSFRSVVIPVLFPDTEPVFTDVIVQLVYAGIDEPFMSVVVSEDNASTAVTPVANAVPLFVSFSSYVTCPPGVYPCDGPVYVFTAVTLLFPSSGSFGPLGSVISFPFTFAVFPILPAASVFTVAVIV